MIPALTTFNPENRPLPLQKPSKCRACTVTSQKTVIIDGEKIVTTTTKLCPGHLLQHPPVAEPILLDLQPPAVIDTPPNSAPPIPNSVPSFTDDIFSALNDDPFAGLNDDPFVQMTPPPGFEDPPNPTAAATITKPPPTSNSSKPIRKKKHSLRNTKAIKDEYVLVLERCHDSDVETSCKELGIGRAMFYRRKAIAELMITDEVAFDDLKSSSAPGIDMKDLNKLCQQRMKSSPLKHAVKQMRKDGILLPSA